MSSTIFLELDSTYRDRKSWPNTGEFQIPISQTGRNGADKAVDPVSLSAPITFWTSNLVDPSNAGNSVSTVVDSISGTNNISAASDATCFIITSAAGNLQRISNYYVGLIANDTTISEVRRIISYTYIGEDSGAVNDRALICVDTAFSDNFAAADTITITDPTDVSDLTYPQIFVPAGRSGDNAYFGYVLYNETLDQLKPISNYNATTHILTLDTTEGDVTSWLITNNFSIRKETPISTGTSQLVVAAGATTSIITVTGGLATADAYVNKFMRIRPAASSGTTTYGSGTPTAPISEMRKITSYTSSTVATVYPAFSVAPTTGFEIEILPFSHDNLNAFSYYGANQKDSYWNVELINASLPNKSLASGEGRRIAYYPYIYIELRNTTASDIGYITSNNPNATSVLFRCAIKDISNPLSSSFVNLDGDKVVQKIIFKPNDNLKLTVRLPNGNIWATASSDTSSPLEPNFLLQTSILFKCTKATRD